MEEFGMKKIEDLLTVDLVRVVHYLARSEPDDVEMVKTAQRLAPFSRDVAWWTENEPELGVWHARFVWPDRGMVRYVRSGQVIRAAVWWLYPGERLREAVEQAGTIYCLATGDWPDSCFVRKRGSGWPESVTVNDGFVEMGIYEAPGMPAGFVMVV